MDKGIISIVKRLQALGFETVTSCQGHPRAYITVRSEPVKRLLLLKRKFDAAFESLHLDEIKVQLEYAESFPALDNKKFCYHRIQVAILRFVNYEKLLERDQIKVSRAIAKLMK